jgi:hypothetical protein
MAGPDPLQAEQQKRARVFAVLTIAGLVLTSVSFFTPMWWVSLTAPNYPEHTFPDGVKILMHWNGVRNGCTLQEGRDVVEDEPMDCVHEMNTINHYIGMHPIERGAQLEFAAAPYIFIASGLMLLGALFYKGAFWWVLFLPGVLMPVAFLVDFAGWLWWFGHNLHEWAAFTVKPFMPTVLGEGKVAQFATFAYPDYGFAIVVAGSLCLTLALLIRRKQLQLHEA